MPETSYPPGHVPPRPIPQPQPLNVVTIGVAQECRCVFGLRGRMTIAPCSIDRT